MIFKKTTILFLILLIFNVSLFSQENEPAPEPPQLKSNFVYASYSALLPGLGQAKKDRFFTGLFFFSAFGASLYNYKLNLGIFREEQKTYREEARMLNLLTTGSSFYLPRSESNSYFLISSVLANQSFARFELAEKRVNEAVLYAVGIYLIQIAHAFFCSPGSYFDKPVDSKSLESSNFNFNFYPTKNQFGQAGANVDLNYTWRF